MEFDFLGDVLVLGVIGEEGGVGFGFMVNEVVGLWVKGMFGSRGGALYNMFDLERFNPFVLLAMLGCEMDRMELISFVWKDDR